MSYTEAKAKYAALGVDTEAAIEKLKQGEPVSDRELRRALAAFKEGISLG